jgi:NADH-quinone oxidoreductase subunit J
VLFLFVVMMLDINIEEVRARVTRYALLGGIVAGVVVFELVSVVWSRSLGAGGTIGDTPLAADYSNTADIGKTLFSDEYVYPFELAAVLLLIAIVAAISLTMRKRPNLKQQDVSAQVAVRSQDRVRIVKVPSEPKEPRS